MAAARALSTLLCALRHVFPTRRALAAYLTRELLSHRIELVGTYSCANELVRHEVDAHAPHAPLVLIADVPWPYYSQCGRRASGFALHTRVATVLHLQRDAPSLTLEAHCVYLVGARVCHVCGTAHDIRRTCCAMILRFFALRSARPLQKRIHTHAPGATVLSTHPRRHSVLRDCNLHTHLCAACCAKARRRGHVWFRMNGRCRNAYCPNRLRCDCARRNNGCVDYVYVPEGFRHNVDGDELADAVRNGHIIALTCALYNRTNIQLQLNRLYATLIAHLRSERARTRTLSMHHLAACCGMYVEELLALCMHEARLADFVQATNKSFTLSVVNGFVALRASQTGPWLDGRLLWDANGCVRHVRDGSRVVVRTINDVSVVRVVADYGDDDDDERRRSTTLRTRWAPSSDETYALSTACCDKLRFGVAHGATLVHVAPIRARSQWHAPLVAVLRRAVLRARAAPIS
eukprot:gb/GEZJ01002533.1/.p1 GENE.gb/GEZJ01002533.1/~~gb/GEZJ01002533.1/.p1  ORF type:complete len:506 (-),score=37.36 gb/GEZJ01002533.1/:124-1512(-)